MKLDRRMIFLVACLSWRATRAEPPAPDYHEFRIYSVISNKMDAVLERFRDTVDPVRRRHGIVTVGYWHGSGPTNGVFVYLLSAAGKEELRRQEKEFGSDPEFKAGYEASTRRHGPTVDSIASFPLEAGRDAGLDLSAAASPRAFELRIYTVPNDRLEAFRNRWRDWAAPIYERHGLHCVGGWVGERNAPGDERLFFCLLAGKTFNSIQDSIGAFHADPEWQRVERETERGGKLRSGVVVYRLTPADFSPLR